MDTLYYCNKFIFVCKYESEYKNITIKINYVNNLCTVLRLNNVFWQNIYYKNKKKENIYLQ